MWEKVLLTIIMAGKMKKMAYFLNILHFCLYRFDYKLHLLSNKINPFRFLAEISFVKKRLEEKGVRNIQKEIDKAFGNKEFGLSVMVAGGALIGILFFFFLAVLNISLKLLSENPTLSNVHFIFCGILTVVLSYFFVFKNDKYLKYFEIFEGCGKADKRKYSWLTLAFVLVVFCLFVLSVKI